MADGGVFLRCVALCDGRQCVARRFMVCPVALFHSEQYVFYVSIKSLNLKSRYLCVCSSALSVLLLPYLIGLCSHAGEETLHDDRFGDEVVGTELEAFRYVVA